jgi:type VI protein secretion system component Hcp
MVMSFGCAAALVVVQSFTFLSQAEAVLTSVRYFLQITDPAILGESTATGHVGEIDLLSFTMSFSQPVTPATCGILRLLKNVDRASPNLVISAILNRHHTHAVLSGVTNDGIVNFRMSLTNVIVLSVNISDSSGVPPATEEVTLQVQRIVLDVLPEDPRSAGAPTATIDCAAKKGA